MNEDNERLLATGGLFYFAFSGLRTLGSLLLKAGRHQPGRITKRGERVPDLSDLDPATRKVVQEFWDREE